MVVPAEFMFIDQNPEEAQAENGPRYDGCRKTDQRLFPVERLLPGRQHSKFPCSQSQGLAAVGPEPTEK